MPLQAVWRASSGVPCALVLKGRKTPFGVERPLPGNGRGIVPGSAVLRPLMPTIVVL